MRIISAVLAACLLLDAPSAEAQRAPNPQHASEVPDNTSREWQDFTGRQLQAVFSAWQLLQSTYADLPPLSTFLVSYTSDTTSTTIYFFGPGVTTTREDGQSVISIAHIRHEVRIIEDEIVVVPPGP